MSTICCAPLTLQLPAGQADDLQHLVVRGAPQHQVGQVVEAAQDSLGEVILLNGDVWLLKHLQFDCGEAVAVLGAHVVHQVK